MENPILTYPNYLATRAALLLQNENFSSMIYFDTKDIPTFSIGVGLIKLVI